MDEAPRAERPAITTTEGIEIAVESTYVPARSAPNSGRYFFAYTVTITNRGDRAARLITRHWIINDGGAPEQHVRGPGVVGETPHLQPGQSFRYTSACPLTHPVGSMRGSYQMRRDDGSEFDARIDPFTLAMPHAIN